MIENRTILFPVADIKVNPRQRSSINEIKLSELIPSIVQNGLIHTILIDESGNLISGEHRLRAFQKLQGSPCPWPAYKDWTLIPARRAKNVTETESLILELEENLKRAKLSWEDTALAVLQVHEKLCEENPDWTQTKTAETLGIHSSEVSRCILVGTALRESPEKFKHCAGLRTAANILFRETKRQVDLEIEDLTQTSREIYGDPIPKAKLEEDIPILQADFTEWASTYSGPRFNFIMCDFPYGINHHKTAQGNTTSMLTYKDTPDVFWSLIEALFTNLDRIAAKSAHIMFWSPASVHTLAKVCKIAESVDLRANPIPMIWAKGSSGILPDQHHTPRQVYETALLFTRGDRPLVRAAANHVASPITKEYHMSEKPRRVLSHFFKMFVDSSTRFLDPTCGSGNSVITAANLGAESVLGLELLPENVELAKTNWRKTRD